MRRIAILTLAFICLMGLATAQQVEFNYNGRVNVMGAPFNGEGQFKLALTNHDGTITYWANDGVTLDGNEPTTAVTLTITDGFFSIDVGDTNIPGMAELNASIFNSTGDVLLRAWFNDGTSGFQRLLPDRKVVNPSLLGLQSGRQLVLYVDPDQGNDLFPGLTTSGAKRTIQAAWNTLPARIQSNITIQLLDGVYREEVLMTGKTIFGNAKVAILGNSSDDSLVRVLGSDAGATTTAVRDFGFRLVGQKQVEVRHLNFEYCKSAGIALEENSSIQVSNCQFYYNRRGVYAASSIVSMNDCEIAHGEKNTANYSTGVYIRLLSSARLDSCNLYDMHQGAVAEQLSVFEFVKNCTSTQNVAGFQVSQNSNLTFRPPQNTVTNNGTGIIGGQNASITYPATYATLSGNGTNYDLRTGSVISE